MSAGIDYSGGRSNFDPETGIHFGVISQHSLGAFAFDDIEFDYGDATCPKCGGVAVEYSDAHENFEPCLVYGCSDYACENCKHTLDSAECFSDDPQGWSINADGYQVINCLDSDAMILKAPYFTRAVFCSPCVPGACSIETPAEDGAKAYCFGHDWFDDGIAPYPVYSVATGELVAPMVQS